jgi:hypothetical protein
MVLIAVIDAQIKCKRRSNKEEVAARRWRKSKNLNPKD